MRSVAYLAMALLLGAIACEETPVNPGTQPDPASMTFKSGARYEYESYHTDPSTGQRTDSTSRRRTWTLVNANASAYGKTGVAVYVDSVFTTVGGIISVADSVYLKQETNNDVYRYASLAPELDLSGVALLDIGRSWMHEAKLNATTARWFVGDVADTLTIPTGLPGLDQVRVALTDSATASTNENVTIGGTMYKATKTTHKLELGFFVLNVPVFGSVKLTSESLIRTTWIVPELGAIVKETREGKLITVNQSIPGLPGQNADFSIPVPGYYSEMKAVLATGN
jgi:hypothetical protein